MPPRHAHALAGAAGRGGGDGRCLAGADCGRFAQVELYASRRPAGAFDYGHLDDALDDELVTGLYIQSGLDLPAALARVIDAVMPGSLA